MAEKYIFLDIDGPLNTGRNDYLNPKQYGHHFDDMAVKNLRRIINETAADIVLSSSWRHMGLTRIKEIWRSWGLPGNVIGCTPGCWGDDRSFSTRGEEIQTWLRENAEEPYSYVILDDIGKEEATPEQQDVWIVVDPYYGISTSDAQYAISILNSSFSSGFPFLDKMTENWSRPQLIVMAARPSCLKTAFALDVARNMAGGGTPVAYFPHDPAEICRRRLQEATPEAELNAMPLYIDDDTCLYGAGTDAFCERIREWVNTRGVRLVVVDYLSMYIKSGEGDCNQIAAFVENARFHMIRSLQELSRELGIAIILIAQLSRKILRRKDGPMHPKISDMYPGASEAAEKYADWIIFPVWFRYIGLVEAEQRPDIGLFNIFNPKNQRTESVSIHYDQDRSVFSEQKSTRE
ncbi:MAG: AAA family ATPase [Bacteroidales bacterium]|nr:AAA family ATPase [Bacteroidales bacterium]